MTMKASASDAPNATSEAPIPEVISMLSRLPRWAVGEWLRFDFRLAGVVIRVAMCS
jgi:hypothetical protein